MTHTAEMLDAYPAEINLDKRELAQAIDALMNCAQTCTACADACLSESPDMLGHLTRCIRDNLDCADICTTTAMVLSRHTGYDARLTKAQVQAAMQALMTCADSCGEHRDMHDHCRVCEEACRSTYDMLGRLEPHLQPSGDAPSVPSQSRPQAGS
ncbi:MAG TPA: four-helix bundle copper-binding protein [Actinopolymorphaceae bacterium]